MPATPDVKESVTIAVPAYVPEVPRAGEIAEHLRRALASVQDQTEPELHCVVFDNSPDPTVVRAMVNSMGDARFRYSHNEANVGLLGSLNRAIAEVETGLLGFVHGDDELHPEYVGSMRRTLRQNPDAAGALCGAQVVDMQGVEIRPLADRIKSVIAPSHKVPVRLSGERAVTRLMFGMWAYSPASMLRPRLLNGLRFNENNLYSGDTEFIVDLLAGGGQLIYTPERLYRYRRHGESGTVQMTRDGTRARLEREFFDAKAVELSASGMPWAALAARARPFARLAALGNVGHSAAARAYR